MRDGEGKRLKLRGSGGGGGGGDGERGGGDWLFMNVTHFNEVINFASQHEALALQGDVICWLSQSRLWLVTEACWPRAEVSLR